MAGPQMKTLTLPCRGGLNLSSNTQELLGKPNEAIRLTNFECSKQGGYRRISGYTILNDSLPQIGRVLGVVNYKGVLACRGTGVYHTLDDTNWVQVNRESDNVNATSVASGNELPRTDATRYMFETHLLANKRYVFLVDGKNNPAVFSIIDEDTTPLYRYKKIIEGTALIGARYVTIFKDQLILGGMLNDQSSIFYSSHATTDLLSPEDDDKEIPQENFNGSTAGFISVGDIVTGVKVHRETLYVFCENSIHKIEGTETGNPVVTNLTRNIGCIDGFTIQEIGGDLLFLAPDGLRNIAKTQRLDDIELGVVSRKVSKLIDPRVRNRQDFEFNSTIIREKNQYRLWFTDLSNIDSSQRGIIAAYTFDSGTGQFAWAYSELEALGVTSVDNTYLNTRERIIHGNQAGEICVQEQGNTFGGDRIPYVYQSPFTDFGDISVRKNIHKVFVQTKPEGDVQLGIELRYDYESSDVHQPTLYPLLPLTLPFIWGDPRTLWGDTLIKWGSADIPNRDVFTEGSAFVVSFRMKSLGEIDDFPFDIQSLQIDLTGGGKV